MNPYEYFVQASYDSQAINGSRATYDNLISNLTIEDVTFSLSNYLQTHEQVDVFKKINHKIGRDMTIK